MSTAIYDGECSICTSLKDYADDRLNHLISFTPYQNEQIKEVVPDLDVEQLRRGLFFITGEGKTYRGARAVFEVMSHMSGFWGDAGKILRVPPLYWIAEPFYRLFAQHRHGLGVGVGTKSE